MQIKKETFDKELSICRKQYQKEKGCSWGRCEDCGVVPFLVKLHEGKLIDDKKEVDEYRKRILI